MDDGWLSVCPVYDSKMIFFSWQLEYRYRRRDIVHGTAPTASKQQATSNVKEAVTEAKKNLIYNERTISIYIHNPFNHSIDTSYINQLRKQATNQATNPNKQGSNMDTEIPMMQYQPSTSSSTVVLPSSFGGHLDGIHHNTTTSTTNISDTNHNSNNSNNKRSNLLHNEVHVVRYAGRQAVCSFLQNYNCLAILKVSTKIIVFDIQTPIQLAFYALVEHGMCVVCLLCWLYLGLFVRLFVSLDGN